jgi:hypothetical protein
MSNPDIVRVRHMLDAAQEALSFVGNKSRSELDANRMLTLIPRQIDRNSRRGGVQYHRHFVKHTRKSPGWLS